MPPDRLQIGDVTTIPVFNAQLPTGDPGGPAFFTVDVLDQAPEPRVQTAPVYPFEERRQGIDGHVVVAFIVDAAGDVTQAHAVSSSRPGFESAAVQAVLRWKFRPGRKDGCAVNVRMQVPILFNLAQE